MKRTITKITFADNGKNWDITAYFGQGVFLHSDVIAKRSPDESDASVVRRIQGVYRDVPSANIVRVEGEKNNW